MFGFVHGDSFLHRLNPSLKLFALILTMASILIYPSWILGGILLVLVILGFVAAKVTLELNMKRVKFLIVFSLILLIFQVILTPNGLIFAYIVPRIGDFGPFFPITDFGLNRGLGISVRFLLIVFASMLFVSVTDPTLLAHSLTRFRVPYRYSFALVIALRFLPLFDHETNSVRMAQRSRGISAEVGNPKKILRTVRYTFFPLLVSALSRVDSLSMSMDGRGFGYHKERTYLRESSWKSVDYLVLFLSVSFLLFSTLLALGLLPQISVLI